MATITEQIYSNEYKDYILPYSDSDVINQYKNYGVQLLDTHYMLLHDRGDTPLFPIQSTAGLYNEYPYVPKVFTTLSTVSLEYSGIIQVQIQPNLNLTGKNTLIGFIDTGIAYTHPAFIDINGETKIMSIWDQTIDADAINSPFQYGTVYNSRQINQALGTSNPLSIVPSTDKNGHGTALAGIAAGFSDPANDFTGAAPEAKISVVKLKPAKRYLYDYYFADPDIDIYQENDIMTAIRFLITQSSLYQMPLIICLGLGTNQGDHDGNSPISQMITYLSYSTHTIFAIACGNEGNQAHHTFQTITELYKETEILIPDNCPGFTAELWGSTNALFSIGFQTPLGTQIDPISIRPGQTAVIPFVLEKTRIEISYSIVTESGGNQLAAFRFSNPTPGNWIIRVYNRNSSNASFHMWLPITGLLSKNVTFFNPDPNTTITIPSDSQSGISTTFYNGYDQRFAINSSRGYTRSGMIKPNLSTPGINLTAPTFSSAYALFSGSSGAAALLAGSASLLQQWRMDMSIPGIFDAAIISGYLSRGAMRENQLNYPNPLWGYGKLNIYDIFTSLMS